MTPERQKWWDSLPANEKELRESLKIHHGLYEYCPRCGCLIDPY